MENGLAQEFTNCSDIVDQMVEILLAAVATFVNVAFQGLLVQNVAHPHSQPVGDIQELVASLVGQQTRRTEQCCPLPQRVAVGMQNLVGGVDSFLQVHELADITVDVGQVHKDGCVRQCKHQIFDVLSLLGLGNFDEFAILRLQ